MHTMNKLKAQIADAIIIINSSRKWQLLIFNFFRKLLLGMTLLFNILSIEDMKHSINTEGIPFSNGGQSPSEQLIGQDCHCPIIGEDVEQRKSSLYQPSFFEEKVYAELGSEWQKQATALCYPYLSSKQVFSILLELWLQHHPTVNSIKPTKKSFAFNSLFISDFEQLIGRRLRRTTWKAHSSAPILRAVCLGFYVTVSEVWDQLFYGRQSAWPENQDSLMRKVTNIILRPFSLIMKGIKQPSRIQMLKCKDKLQTAKYTITPTLKQIDQQEQKVAQIDIVPKHENANEMSLTPYNGQIASLKSSVSALSNQTVCQSEQISNLKNLLQAEIQLNKENSDIIASMNQKILKIKPRILSRERSLDSSSIETVHLQCSGSLEQLLEHSEINSNNQQLTLARKADLDTMLVEITSLRRENHQMKVDMGKYESNSQSEYLIEYLTQQLEQERARSQEIKREVKELQHLLSYAKGEFSQKKRRLLMVNPASRLSIE